jgi:hypothetical protein
MENLRKPYDEKIYWRMSTEWFDTVKEINKMLLRVDDEAPMHYPIGNYYFDSLYKHVTNPQNFTHEIPFTIEKPVNGEIKKIKFYLTR